MKNFIKINFRKLKRIVRALFGKDLFLSLDLVDLKKKKFGSSYGGWDVIISDLNQHSIVYSFGVGEDASFDMALIKEYGLKVFAFDPTPKSVKWVKDQNFPNNFIFFEFGIASFDGHVLFNPPENSDHVSHTMLDRPSTKNEAISVPVKKYSTILQELKHSTIDVLKIDIEGAEYEVINDILLSSVRPKQFLIEFHHRFPNVGLQKTKYSLQQLRQAGYLLFSESDSGEEFGFIYGQPK